MAQTFPVWNVSNQQMPPGCQGRTITYVSQLSGTQTDTLDLTQAVLQKTIDQIQSVFVDNSLNGSSVSIQCRASNHKVVIPKNSQAWMPILVVQGSEFFDIASSGGVVVPLFFCNVPMPAAVWAV